MHCTVTFPGRLPSGQTVGLGTDLFLVGFYGDTAGLGMNLLLVGLFADTVTLKTSLPLLGLYRDTIGLRTGLLLVDRIGGKVSEGSCTPHRLVGNTLGLERSVCYCCGVHSMTPHIIRWDNGSRDTLDTLFWRETY